MFINSWFPLIISVMHWHFDLKLGMYVYHENLQVKFKFGFGRIIFGRVMPLGLGIVFELMTSIHYLGHVLTFLIENRYVGSSWEYAGQEWIWFRLNNAAHGTVFFLIWKIKIKNLTQKNTKNVYFIYQNMTLKYSVN